MSDRTLRSFLRGTYKPRWSERLDITAGLILLYIASGVAVNVFAKHFPDYKMHLPFSDDRPITFPIIPGTALVGLIFVMRDYTQRLIGDWVICCTLAASITVYFAVDEFIAVYSALAFLVSEGIDQLAWKWLGKEDLKDRILWSSAASTWIDGALILTGLGILNWPNFISHYIGKMASVFAIWLVLRHQHNKRFALREKQL